MMKTKITILFFLSICCIGNIQAELKHFLPHSNAVMSILDEKYWFDGDTIIENKRYTKVYRQYCSSEIECSDLDYYAAVREDTIAEKIYCIQTNDGIERLIANFAVEAGDQVTVYSFWPWGEDRIARVKNVDSVMIDNTLRKRINIIDERGWHGEIYDSWIEGIGSTNGLFFPGNPMIVDGGEPPVLLCVYIDDILIYQNIQYNTCYLPSYVDIPEINPVNFKIYPTIVDNIMYIDKKDGPYSYRIYNYQGTIIQFGLLSTELINVSDFNPGVYYIVFYNDNTPQLCSNKFIKR